MSNHHPLPPNNNIQTLPTPITTNMYLNDPTIPEPPEPPTQPIIDPPMHPKPLIEVFLCTDVFPMPTCLESNFGYPTATIIDPQAIMQTPTAYIFAFRNPYHLHDAFVNAATYQFVTRYAHFIRLYLLHDLQIGYQPCSATSFFTFLPPPTSSNVDNLFYYDNANDPSIYFITPPHLPTMPTIKQPRPVGNRICIVTWLNLDALMDNWRLAFRAIPRGHEIWYLVFELSAREPLVPWRVGRALQILSTAVCLKERVKGRFRCVVEGCSRGVAERFDEFLVGNVASLGWSVVGDDDDSNDYHCDNHAENGVGEVVDKV
ncbi:hypothetical protein AbraIFM66950_004694 [Aspergillus brasiliensis]|nr:hypothetical protein AbraIFM66950_004694 [Aspergillus brasiliensis]